MANTGNISKQQGEWLQALAQAWDDEGLRQALLDEASTASGTEAHALARHATEMPADRMPPCFC